MNWIERVTGDELRLTTREKARNSFKFIHLTFHYQLMNVCVCARNWIFASLSLKTFTHCGKVVLLLPLLPWLFDRRNCKCRIGRSFHCCSFFFLIFCSSSISEYTWLMKSRRQKKNCTQFFFCSRSKVSRSFIVEKGKKNTHTQTIKL